ncbi:hypothetical protein [Pseudolactococcus hodotermopsidis]|uniref:hypothetical protein n=1 Tax=Pseudolactococcus hodotermopsidis TaxID=2709157 RepID=UPI00155568F4|nr:hypothetical protein [Lactococcus hodotermopsidis]
MNKVDCLPEYEIKKIVSTYTVHKPELCADFLSQIIYLVVKRVKNIPENSLSNIDTSSSLPLAERIEEYFTKGHYYKNYELHFEIKPNKKLGVFEVWSSSKFVIENLEDDLSGNGKSYHHRVDIAKINNINNREVLKFEVNGKDHKDIVTNAIKNIQTNKNAKDFKYYYEYTINNIPEEKEYRFESEHRRKVTLPLYRFNSSLKYPSKQFHLTVEITGDEKDDWKLYVPFKSPFHRDLKSENSYIRHSFDNSVSINVNEWLLKGSGFTIFVTPKKEKWNDWQE